MALKSKRAKSELPEGAVAVSEEEALKYQKSFVSKWPSETEVLCLKFGSTFAGAMTVLSSYMITNHFRAAFKSDFKIISLTFIPGFGVPYYFTKYFTEKNVTDNILLMKVQCPMCITAKFAVQQFYSSILFPSLYSFATYAMYSEIRGRQVLPSFQKHPTEYWKEVSKMFKSGARTFQIIGLLQTVMILFMPYWQQQELCNISKKSEEKETELLYS